MIICYITFYLSNNSFKTLKNIYIIWKFVSHWYFVQMKWFEFTFFKISIMYIITFISFWKFKIIWKKVSWISSFNNISMTILLKKKCNKWFLKKYNNTTYVKLLSNIIWLFFINLNYFTLHYLRLFMVILNYFWLFFVISL
jgi:hypothetical protein